MACANENHSSEAVLLNQIDCRISGVLRKRAPFLKMYSEYINNYKTATKVYDECLKKRRRFAQIVQEIEVSCFCSQSIMLIYGCRSLQRA